MSHAENQQVRKSIQRDNRYMIPKYKRALSKRPSNTP